MTEPRCKNCGHAKLAHTAELLLCPKAELITYTDHKGEQKQKWKWFGYLETTYKE